MRWGGEVQAVVLPRQRPPKRLPKGAGQAVGVGLEEGVGLEAGEGPQLGGQAALLH